MKTPTKARAVRFELPPAAHYDELDRLSVTTLRTLAMDAVQQANSGHPGLPMGAADMAYVLCTRFLKHNPVNPAWPDRDRFVLSAGHGCMLLYGLLYLSGYDLSLEEIKRFRQWGSRTPGHSEYGLTPGVETTTGPLGQGFANGVGMALAEAHLAARFNRPGYAVVDHYTYAIVSDGDHMEGISHEAASLAGHLGLGKLVYLYDANGISIDGPTSLAFTEDVAARFVAYGWHVQAIDGHDMVAVEAALHAARAETTRPSLIVARTHIGYGSPNRQDTAKAHGEPLGEEEVRLTKERYGWSPEAKFYIPEEVVARFRECANKGAVQEDEWRNTLARYAQEHPELAAQFRAALARELPEGWDTDLPNFPTDKPLATRAASGKLLDTLAPRIPTLIGGSGDLTGSNNTLPKGEEAVKRGDFSGRYIHFGVREHAMGGILNGLALHGGLFPYGGTFLIFSDYMRPSIRLAALMHQPVIFVFTHDSIGLGEDGPTHQPVEHLASLRAMPNLVAIRPADATETVEAWRVALSRRDGPTALLLTRQAVPVVDRSVLAPARGVAKGGYVLADVERPDVILIGTGSEVHLALAAQKLLAQQGVAARVVSLPSTDLFERQPAEYQEAVLPPGVGARVAVEAAATFGWERYVGAYGTVVGLDRFGASAPYKAIFENLGLTAEAVAAAALRVLGRPAHGKGRIERE
ncbi:MAG: transketolase [Candidatus Methylomirabilales bacterium]